MTEFSTTTHRELRRTDILQEPAQTMVTVAFRNNAKTTDVKVK